MNKPPVTVSDIIEQLPVSRLHVTILMAAAFGFAFDSFDTYIVSYAMPSIVREWQIDSITNGLLTSAGMWGMLCGALAWGPLTDGVGRRPAFCATVFGFAALSGFTALAGGVVTFGLLRFVTGMCLGGMIPVDTALMSEFTSARVRGRFVAVLTVLWPFGLLAAALCSLLLVPTHGWRVLFVIGVAPAFLAAWAAWRVPESPRWLSTKGRMSEAKRVLEKLGADPRNLIAVQADEVARELPLRTLLREPYAKRFVLTAGYYLFSYFGYYGFVLWLPSILASIYHLSLATTFTYTLYVALAAIAGRVTAFWTIERYGRKQLFYVGFGVGGLMALAFGIIQTPSLAVYVACLMSFLYEQGVAGTVVWTAELYPSKVRATAVAWSTAAGRISAALSPVVFGALIGVHAYYSVYVTMAASFWMTVVLVYYLGVETKGKSLQELGAA